MACFKAGQVSAKGGRRTPCIHSAIYSALCNCNTLYGVSVQSICTEYVVLTVLEHYMALACCREDVLLDTATVHGSFTAAVMFLFLFSM